MTSPMTPAQAREGLKRDEPRVLIPGAGHYQSNDGYRALATIAGMDTEWGVTAQFGAKRLVLSNPVHGNAFPAKSRRFPTKAEAEAFMAAVTATDPRLVHRHVTEVIDSE